MKWDKFVYFPMNDKPVEKIPGIGPVSGSKLRQRWNITKAFQVYNKFWEVGKRQDLFKIWLREACDARWDYAADCYDAMYNYSENFSNSLCGIPDFDARLINNMICITIVIKVRLQIQNGINF